MSLSASDDTDLVTLDTGAGLMTLPDSSGAKR
jgi:hypothetical protein